MIGEASFEASFDEKARETHRELMVAPAGARRRALRFWDWTTTAPKRIGDAGFNRGDRTVSETE
ncbi:MAG: hypothetical protein ACRECE_11400, partial [Xanthobacteraceae bacterium]